MRPNDFRDGLNASPVRSQACCRLAGKDGGAGTKTYHCDAVTNKPKPTRNDLKLKSTRRRITLTLLPLPPTSQNELKALDVKLKRLFATAPKRPTTDPSKVASEIASLEFKRSTTSMSLNDEKKLLKDIEKLAASRRLTTDFEAHQREIDEAKNRAAAIRYVAFVWPEDLTLTPGFQPRAALFIYVC